MNSLEELLRMSVSYDVPLSLDQAELVLRHLNLVIEKNRVLNLTRIDSISEGIVKHILDSLLFMKGIPQTISSNDHAQFVDVGTGAGFPGIPLVVMGAWRGLLIDSVGKKSRAVREFVEELGLRHRVSVETVRAEDLAHSNPLCFDVVTARAVAEISVLLEYASPLLKRDGLLVCSKAHVPDTELRHAKQVAPLCGFHHVSRETFELPLDMGHREILSYRKTGAATVRLPRQAGMAKHMPL